MCCSRSSGISTAAPGRCKTTESSIRQLCLNFGPPLLRTSVGHQAGVSAASPGMIWLPAYRTDELKGIGSGAKLLTAPRQALRRQLPCPVLGSNQRRLEPTVLQTPGGNAVTCASVGIGCDSGTHWT